VHFDTAERGFSFRFDGPLDMRLDNSKGETASDLVNTLPYEKMAEIFRLYGDEPRAGFIAKKIIEARAKSQISTTKQLADIVYSAWHDALPRIFQALRIAVNGEYSSLETLLASATHYLTSG
jgi:16S rRNA (cytosine1402-N4)-methyltransferase